MSTEIIDKKKNILDWILSKPILLDGAWGTQLQLRGLSTGEHPDLWNLTHADKVAEVAEAYVNAGSDIILTNTFGSSKFPLERHNAQNKLHEINTTGVNISKNAAKDKAKVFASVGPTGMMLLSGNVTEQQLLEAFEEQIYAINSANPDGIVIETMCDTAEAAIAIKAAKNINPNLPVAACMVFDSGKNKDRTMMGTTPEQAVKILTDAGADIIGSNCGQGIEGFIPICKRIRSSTNLPIWIKANAGLPQIINGVTAYSQSPENFAQFALQLIESGTNLIGGCCGTTPEFIETLRKSLNLKAS
jgi:methionine synthase I (cobalamin-dependent)